MPSLISPAGTILEANTQVAPFRLLVFRYVRIYTSCSVLHFRQSSARGAKTIQLETEALHFNQKSTVSLSYLALETGQSRAAVSCSSTLLTATALQISLLLSKLQRAGLLENVERVRTVGESIAGVKMSSL